MNAICRVLSVTACLTLFATCGPSTSKGKEGINEEVTPSKSEKNNSDDKNLIVFTINKTETVSSTGQNIGRFSLGGKKCINITSNMHKDTRTINMNIAGTTVGTYQLGTGLSGSYGTYHPDFMHDAANSYKFISGEVTIIEVDTIKNILNATFFGKLRNGKNEELGIKDGQVVNGKLNKGITSF
jgi:hypothetical protein